MVLDHKTILFQGDSITDMNRGRNQNDLNHIYGHSFVFLLASHFGCKQADKQITVYNRGISGDRSENLTERWEEDALFLNPDIISILVGINDAEYGVVNGIEDLVERYTENMHRIIGKTLEHAPNTRFILCEPFFIRNTFRDDKSVKDAVSQKIRLIQAEVRAIARTYDCVFVPLQEVFDRAFREYPELGERHWCWDGIHPTAAGHGLIARQWLRCVTGMEM